MKAERLKQVDQDYRSHLQAFLNFQVKATRKAGKGKERPVYSTFKRFYNYEKEVERVKSPDKSKSRLSGISKFLKKGE